MENIKQAHIDSFQSCLVVLSLCLSAVRTQRGCQITAETARKAGGVLHGLFMEVPRTESSFPRSQKLEFDVSYT